MPCMLVATSTAGTQVGDRMDPAVQAETSIAKRSVSPPPKKRRKKKKRMLWHRFPGGKKNGKNRG